MTSPFDRALERTLAYEGGLSDHPGDRGGRTNYGITQRTYDNWRKTVGKVQQSVDLITDDEVRTIYHDDYWLPCHCDDLGEPLGGAVFDMAVHSGPWNAKLALQRALQVRADGVIGPITIRASKAMPNATLRLLKQRAALYQDILLSRPDQVIFLEGWINRLLDQAWRGA